MRCLIVLVVCALSGCGSGTSSVSKVGGENSPSVIAVQLNDTWCAVANYPCTPFPSESVELVDTRSMNVPTQVDVVGGSYAGGNPGQSLGARLLVGGNTCEYSAATISDTVLTLQGCSGGIGLTTTVTSGTVIELYNYNAPGLLLEVHFNLVR